MKKMFVLMALVVVLAVPAVAANLVTNGTFETGLDGWTQWNCTWGSGFVWDRVTPGVDGASYSAYLATNHGSFGLAQLINVVPGKQYKVTADWAGAEGAKWIEVIFCNNDGRPLLDQMDAPIATAIIAKHEETAAFGPESITAALRNSNIVTATESTMWVGIKAGAWQGHAEAMYDNIVVEEVVPEPSSLLALASGIGALGFGLRRKIR